MLDSDLDWVRCGRQIRKKSPCCEVEEQEFRVWVPCLNTRCLTHAGHGAEVGEALLEPEIVPPFHSCQVTEPHVSELVQVDVGMHLVGRHGPFIGWLQHIVSEGDRADVLHSADAELGHVDHIILGEGEILAEELIVKPDSFADQLEHFRCVKVLSFTLSGEDSHRGGCISCRVLYFDEITRTEAVDVRANRRTLFEIPEVPISRQQVELTLADDALGLRRPNLSLFD